VQAFEKIDGDGSDDITFEEFADFFQHAGTHTLHPAPCTLHPAPCTLHPAPAATTAVLSTANLET